MWTRRNNLAYLHSKVLRLFLDLPYFTISQSIKKANLEKKKSLLNFGSGPVQHYNLSFAEEMTSLDLVEKADFKSLQEMNDKKTFDYIICFEVLEHCEHPEEVLRSLSHFLKREGKILISTPLNARFHPSPKDFHRFTPDSIYSLAKLTELHVDEIIQRGSNLTTIANKIIYLFFYLLLKPKSALFAVLFMPLTFILLILAHLDLFIFKKSWGDDPIGYFYVLSQTKHDQKIP